MITASRRLKNVLPYTTARTLPPSAYIHYITLHLDSLFRQPGTTRCHKMSTPTGSLLCCLGQMPKVHTGRESVVLPQVSICIWIVEQDISVEGVRFRKYLSCMVSGSRDKTMQILHPHRHGSYCVVLTANFSVFAGDHDKPVKGVCFQKDLSCVVSGSWDKTMRVWDPRQGTAVSNTALPDKVFTLAVCVSVLSVESACPRQMQSFG